jgi:acetylglutamate kinase
MLEKLKIKSEFVQGLRVTDASTVEIVEMVLGNINKELVSRINRAGGLAVGISGKDANLLTVEKLHRTVKDPDSNIERALDLGFVGEPSSVDPHVLNVLSDAGMIPVIAPVGIGAGNETYNINADTVAGAVAGALRATRLLLLTDVVGVLDGNKRLLPELSASQAQRLIQDGTINGGMIPKVETCLRAVRDGVEAAVILDGRVPRALVLESFTSEGVGTIIGNACFAAGMDLGDSG